MSTGTYTTAARSISAFNSDFGEGAKLSSYFQSTTADQLLTDYSSSGAGAPGRGRTRNAWDWGDPSGEYSIGETANTTPVGEPYVLLVMAMLYLGYRYYRSCRRRRILTVEA